MTNIDTIREALERLKGFTYHAASSQDSDDIKTLIAALSTIDLDKIESEKLKLYSWVDAANFKKNEYLARAEKAEAALSTIEADAKPQEPCEGATKLAESILKIIMDNILYVAVKTDMDQSPIIAALITAHDDVIRREGLDELLCAAKATLRATDRVAFAWKVGKCGPLSPKSCYVPDIAKALDRLRAALSTTDPDAKHIDPIYDPAIASVRNKQLKSHDDAIRRECAALGKAEWFRDTKTITWSRIERAILGTEPAREENNGH